MPSMQRSCSANRKASWRSCIMLGLDGRHENHQINQYLATHYRFRCNVQLSDPCLFLNPFMYHESELTNSILCQVDSCGATTRLFSLVFQSIIYSIPFFGDPTRCFEFCTSMRGPPHFTFSIYFLPWNFYCYNLHGSFDRSKWKQMQVDGSILLLPRKLELLEWKLAYFHLSRKLVEASMEADLIPWRLVELASMGVSMEVNLFPWE